MKTLTQYREDIKGLLAEVANVRARCTAENRDPVPLEVKRMNDLMTDVEEIEAIVAGLDRQEKFQARMDEPQGPPQTRQSQSQARPPERCRDRFGSFGEQLVAVVRAAGGRGAVDPRLLNIQAAATGLGESVPSDGGFLVQQDFATEILQDTFSTGILARRCRQQPISSNANGIKIPGVDETSRASTRYGGVLAYWKGEAESPTATKPKFRIIDLNLKKLIGLCYATDELMTDAAALESFIRQAFPGEFGFQLDDAIINGGGGAQPLGVLNSGALVSVSKEAGQAGSTILAENIINMYSRMFASSLDRAEWFVNQNTIPQLFTLSLAVGTGGVPLFMPAGGIGNQPYNMLLGRPIVPIEQCASLGTVGDIIFADFGRGYVLAQKSGIQADMSIHVQFLQDESVFRFILRVDGQPVRASALTPYKGGATSTQSHFVALATRA